MCGGTQSSRLFGESARHDGLSPRVRGNRHHFHRVVRCHSTVYPRVCGGTGVVNDSGDRYRADGSIPACAGEPVALSCRQARTPWEVYPRVCGGTPSIAGIPSADGKFGLSPRVRGNPSVRAHVSGIPFAGLSPRVRGNLASRARPGSSSPTGLSPRVRGNPYPTFVCRLLYQGLSPRVRGNPADADTSVTINRSIPACAGEPASTRTTIFRRTVYPRVCGGTDNFTTARDYYYGLSPRVRGNRDPKMVSEPEKRSIPACAGNPLIVAIGIAAYRSIPACAGEPHQHRDVSWHRTVYPRVCGGTTSHLVTLGHSAGLSPRVRGNLHQLGRQRRQ